MKKLIVMTSILLVAAVLPQAAMGQNNERSSKQAKYVLAQATLDLPPLMKIWEEMMTKPEQGKQMLTEAGRRAMEKTREIQEGIEKRASLLEEQEQKLAEESDGDKNTLGPLKAALLVTARKYAVPTYQIPAAYQRMSNGNEEESLNWATKLLCALLEEPKEYPNITKYLLSKGASVLVERTDIPVNLAQVAIIKFGNNSQVDKMLSERAKSETTYREQMYDMKK